MGKAAIAVSAVFAFFCIAAGPCFSGVSSGTDGDFVENIQNNRLKWRNLEKSMGMKLVESQCGKPKDIKKMSEDSEQWIYPNGGSMTFVKGILISWKEPWSYEF